MPMRHFQTEWGNPSSYSQAVRFGDLIFTCGQLGAEPGGNAVDFAEQAETALRRLVTVVESAGGSIATILRINGYLQTMDDFEAYDEVYRRVVAVEPKPTRTTVQIGGFVEPLLVEVDAVAHVLGA
jgi:2-iminobutanoate/2-iminopropanoate deaminase